MAGSALSVYHPFISSHTVMQCPACKATLSKDSTHCRACGRSLAQAHKLALWLDLALAAALVALSCVTILWLGF